MISGSVKYESRSIVFVKNAYFTALYQQCLEEINTINKTPVILAIIQLGLAEFLDQVLQENLAQSRGPMFH
jgi:hypothetical protein